MSSEGRQSVGDKISDAVKPDSQKSTPEEFGDKIKSNADSAAGKLQPEEDKGFVQKASDAVFGYITYYTWLASCFND
ncbi:hypothetical protein KGF54_004486 [Candida jiufengensis]|uniref:uncharacterized protein n=1 Tax=Candida jiufengensis TaxID=497108 RepID=UPI002224C8C5|nr:uncharacterized protein KGF54_004486 [Candida jiufengensis]KAI5951412.1 hypothetical protein KGF54_004486 [Candida jiufengensis]